MSKCEDLLYIGTKTYNVYVLLDKTKPGFYKFGKLEFDYEPFYVGQGKNKRAERSSDGVWGPNVIKSYKDERINEIERHNVGIMIIGFFNNKFDAVITESKVINLIDKKYLTNSMFPYLQPSDRKLTIKECLWHIRTKRFRKIDILYELKSYHLKYKRDRIISILKESYNFGIFGGYPNMKTITNKVFNIQFENGTLNPKIKYKMKRKKIYLPYPYEKIMELLDIDPFIIELCKQEKLLKYKIDKLNRWRSKLMNEKHQISKEVKNKLLLKENEDAIHTKI